MPKVNLRFPDQEETTVLDCRIERDQFAITLHDTVYEGTLIVTGPGEGWLNYGGRILPFYMTQKQETLSIWLNGKTYHLNLVSAGSRREGAASAGVSDGEIKAPMPGTILKVLVKAGDTVEANQPLIIMESMKMEMTLSAPHAATVATISGLEGQLVEMGAVLAKLETHS